MRVPLENPEHEINILTSELERLVEKSGEMVDIAYVWSDKEGELEAGWFGPRDEHEAIKLLFRGSVLLRRRSR